ncbi:MULTISPECIES: AAA family ATPase [Serratia]|uniref:AAA family ATPase n=1 Tax=Serratia TaxID=613 RepID=UPI0029DC9265|nr:ATP-binding protein [Serratia marcescens]MDX7543769.1 ATP-binding protein [Serratia marcescens]MDX7565400.1 ATP-binding protein [Serratia marcescens]BEM57464.1 ATPase AAA [Serratia marcescens]
MVNLSNDVFIDVINDALSGRKDSLVMRLRIMSKKLKKESPDLASKLENMLIQSEAGISAARAQPVAPRVTPVDADTRQKLLVETYPVVMDVEPVWPSKTAISLNRFVSEWEMKERLHKEGLNPSRSLLMGGPPGVGKTLAAKWLASKLEMPLLTLDLASVMSSYLGKTGNNIRAVLNYASSFPCVLLLDEFDAIAKKRDDATDVGELKRLVTVLLQAIDEWPSTSILIAATNHADLLDPAAWRRFDRVVSFEYPTTELLKTFLLSKDIPESLASYIAEKLDKVSYAVIERAIHQAKRNSIIEQIPLSISLIEEMIPDETIENVIISLIDSGVSQRKISSDLELPRSQIRKFNKVEGEDNE